MMNEFSLNYEEMIWEDAIGYPSGTKIKMLKEENSKKTFLLKLPGGFRMDAHSHTAVSEQHFVLEGSYGGDGKTYRKGSYRFISRGTTHGPFTCAEGATILVIWDT